jgi:hypothetical protein
MCASLIPTVSFRIIYLWIVKNPQNCKCKIYLYAHMYLQLKCNLRYGSNCKYFKPQTQPSYGIFNFAVWYISIGVSDQCNILYKVQFFFSMISNRSVLWKWGSSSFPFLYFFANTTLFRGKYGTQNSYEARGWELFKLCYLCRAIIT